MSNKIIGVEIKVDVDVDHLADYLEDWFEDEEVPCDGYYMRDLDDEEYERVLIEVCKTVISRYEKKE